MTQEITYSTNMKPLYINIAHIHKTLNKSQNVHWLYNKTSMTQEELLPFEDDALDTSARYLRTLQ